MSKNFLVAEARARFGELLDAADQGATVIIERRGVRYELKASPVKASARKRPGRYFEISDPAVAGGQWTWSSRPGGVRFTPRRSRARR